jgi:tetratricopeptide (TPR) repeat protein
MIKYEDFAEKAFAKKEYRESMFYYKKISESCPDSVKHACLYLESLIALNPFDMTDCVSYTTRVQNKFIEYPEFLFWRGRILIYNGQLDIGKKHIKQALSIDPDRAKY